MAERYLAQQLSQMLLRWSAGPGPLHRRLSEGIGQLIELGALPTGSLLPPERQLAAALAVSRTTVVAAYDNLRQDGQVERRQGSGTRVSHRYPTAGTEREIVSSRLLAGNHAAGHFLSEPIAVIDFSMGAQPCLPLVADVAATITRQEYLELGSRHHGYHPQGLPTLRERLAKMYSAQDLPTAPDQILITSGAQQAIELITAGCLQHGDVVVVEEPTYRGALEAFTQAGCRQRSLPCDADGMDMSALGYVARSGSVRMAYVQSVNNPSGAVLSAVRRQRLAQIAEGRQLVVLDDTSLADTQYQGPYSAPVAAYNDSEWILTVGSMSKLFWGGLRLGWIRGSARTVSRLAQIKGFTDLGTSLISQQIGLHLLDHLDDARKVRCLELAQGAREMCRLLSEFLPQWTWQAPGGGGSLWVCMPGADSAQFSQVALRFGVAISPGTVFSANAVSTEHTRLPFALDRPVLRVGVRRLARAWNAYSDRAPGYPLVLAARGGRRTNAGSSPGPFTVVYITGVSGAYAQFAAANTAALRASASVINASGGIDGRRVVISVANDNSDPTRAVSLLQRALATSSPPDLVAFSTSDEGTALMPILNSDKILTMTSTALDNAAAYPYTVSLSFDQVAAYRVVRKRLEAEGARRVGFVSTNDGGGRVFWAAFKEAFAGSGIAVYDEPVNLDSLNVVPNMVALKDKHIDHLVVESYTSLTSYIFAARTEAGMNDIPTIGDSPVAQTNPWKAIAAPNRTNVVLLAANPQIAGAESGPGWNQFIAALKKAGPISILQSQAMVYTGLQAVAAAAKKAGSTSTDAIIRELRGKELTSNTLVYPQTWQTVSSSSTLLREPASGFQFVNIAPYNSLGQFPASAVVK
jgi:DNA-binding transcriptional MocR family regulator